jgi:hypothetical protein
MKIVKILNKMVLAGKEADNTLNTPHYRDNQRQEFYKLKKELIDLMGEEAYNKMISTKNILK